MLTRYRLLLLTAVLCLCASGMALDNGNYLVRNVETGKYWGVGNSWGTQASLTDNPEYLTLEALSDGRYHMESRVDNGESAYYFNGDFMDNATPVALTIELQSNGYYTIGNGSIYYGYDGSSTVLGKSETNPASPNVQWEIISLADARAALGQATQSNPQNATFLIGDANFGRNNRDYSLWTFEAENKNNEGNVVNYCVESWHALFTMSQTLNVPNGVYLLKAQGFYRQDGSDEEHLPVFFANDATRVFPKISGTENSMTDASNSFSSGLYAIAPMVVTVTDGTLTLGARLEENTNLWCIWDNFTLMYYGTEADAGQMAFEIRFGSIVAEIGELQNTEGVTTEGQSKISEALTAYNGIDKNSAEDVQQTVEDRLKTAISYVKEGLALTGRLADLYARYSGKLTEKSENDNALKTLLLNIGVALSTKTYESNSVVNEWINGLTASRRQYYPYEYRYWFDDDDSKAKEGVSEVSDWSFAADVSSLPENIHTFHLQVSDKDGVLSSPKTKFFVKIPNPDASQGRYWFDNDIDQMQTLPQIQGAFDIDVSHLSEGLHTIHYQVVGTEGNVSQTASRSFYKVYIPVMSHWRCWFDNDETTTQSGSNMDEALLLDVTQLKDGYHLLHIQVDGGAQSASVPITKPFIKVPQVIGVDHLTCLCMIDDKLYKQEDVSAQGGVVEWQFDVSSLPQGFHRMFIQVITPSGVATSAYQSFFIRETTSAEFADLKCVYAIDGAEFFTEAGQQADGTFHFDLDVSHLDDGLHRISYMLANGSGVSTKAQTQFFVKTPLGGNGITEYWYWQNDQADYNATKVTLPERQDPFSLITLLPVESLPIRSSQFQFRVEDEQPAIYAKNDIHVRFYDASGRFTDATRQYVDESVMQEVTDVTLLNPGDRKTVNRPGENAIVWYKVNVQRGDSLAFRTDYPCTIQLFSPSGEELYSVNGPEALAYGGSYAPEDGTYYLALHDVTSQYCSHLSVEYSHIDKYAVLACSPDTIGVYESLIDMSIDGNGFDKLENICLRLGEKTIQPDTIEVHSKSLMKVKYTIEGTEDEGDYDLVLNFDDGGVHDSLVLRELIRLEGLKMGDVLVKVTPSRKLESPYTVTLSVTNTGNIGKLYIPFNIAMTFDLTNSSGPSKWATMKTMNFDLDSGNTVGYSPFTTSYNLFGTGMPGMVVHMFIPRLGPNETKDYVIGFEGSSHARFYLYGWTGAPLNAGYIDSGDENNVYSIWKYLDNLHKETRSLQTQHRAAPDYGGFANGLDVAREIDRTGAANQAGVAAGSGAAIGGYVNGLRLRNNDALTHNGDDDFAQQVLDEDYNPRLKDYMPTPGVIGDLAGIPGWLQGLLGLQGRQAECPHPMPDPHEIELLNPGDPNDIIGYTSESGSKYMREEITDVYYTIEFENDPELANASAHTIVVRDTLDPHRFDLSTFAAKSVKLGNKVMELDGEGSFSKRTMDLRPDINVLAQVSLALDKQKGISTWTIESLDPMSMEPTEDAMQGVLPVNVNGNGQGELMFDIKLKPGMSEGESVANRAGIVFDQEGLILTPTWVNTVDATAPVSHIADVTMATDSTASVRVDASDALSGPWRYNVYVQYGNNEWGLGASNVPMDTIANVKVYEGINHGFYVVVTDSAGNVEQKNAEREFTFEVFESSSETNTTINLNEGWNWISHNQQEPLSSEALKSSSVRVVGQMEELILDSSLGWFGDLEDLQPTHMYKLQVSSAASIPLSGLLFNAEFRSIPLRSGWNWIGYPVANVMSPNEALSRLDAEEGDVIIGQAGMAVFTDGEWVGTLTELEPGRGYMYQSNSYKNLFYNTAVQASSRQVVQQHRSAAVQVVDMYKYPNVMGVVANLTQDSREANLDEWTVFAFHGDECRGVAQTVNGVLMMNVYGNNSETINFYAFNNNSEDVIKADEEEEFRVEVLGTMQHPYELHIGEMTGVSELPESQDNDGDMQVYDLQGRRMASSLSELKSRMKKGFYILTNGKKNETQKILW